MSASATAHSRPHKMRVVNFIYQHGDRRYGDKAARVVLDDIDNSKRVKDAVQLLYDRDIPIGSWNTQEVKVLCSVIASERLDCNGQSFMLNEEDLVHCSLNCESYVVVGPKRDEPTSIIDTAIKEEDEVLIVDDATQSDTPDGTDTPTDSSTTKQKIDKKRSWICDEQGDSQNTGPLQNISTRITSVSKARTSSNNTTGSPNPVNNSRVEERVLPTLAQHQQLYAATITASQSPREFKPRTKRTIQNKRKVKQRARKDILAGMPNRKRVPTVVEDFQRCVVDENGDYKFIKIPKIMSAKSKSPRKSIGDQQYLFITGAILERLETEVLPIPVTTASEKQMPLPTDLQDYSGDESTIGLHMQGRDSVAVTQVASVAASRSPVRVKPSTNESTDALVARAAGRFSASSTCSQATTPTLNVQIPPVAMAERHFAVGSRHFVNVRGAEYPIEITKELTRTGKFQFQFQYIDYPRKISYTATKDELLEATPGREIKYKGKQALAEEMHRKEKEVRNKRKKETVQSELPRSVRQKPDSANGHGNDNAVQGNTANCAVMNANGAPSSSLPNMSCNSSNANAINLTANAHANPNATLLNSQAEMTAPIHAQQQPYPHPHFLPEQSALPFAQNLVRSHDQFLPLTHPVSASSFTQHLSNPHNPLPKAAHKKATATIAVPPSIQHMQQQYVSTPAHLINYQSTVSNTVTAAAMRSAMSQGMYQGMYQGMHQGLHQGMSQGMIQGICQTSTDKQYSAENVRARMASDDGSVRPVNTPRMTKNGLFVRPAGRRRKGMDWDAVNGKWVPMGSMDMERPLRKGSIGK